MTISKTKLAEFKSRLEAELEKLKADLAKVGKKSLEKDDDWEPSIPEDLNLETNDPGDMADAYEELENRAAVEDSLEKKYKAVEDALLRIKKGAYGKCEVCGKPISEARLEANPSASTCVEHADGK